MQYIYKSFRKINYTFALTRASTCAYQWVRKDAFAKKITYLPSSLNNLRKNMSIKLIISVSACDKHFQKKLEYSGKSCVTLRLPVVMSHYNHENLYKILCKETAAEKSFIPK